MHDVGAEALLELIDSQVQPTLPSRRTKEIKLDVVVETHQVVGRHANQTEGPGMVELTEEIDANCIKSLRDISRFAEPALTGQDPKVGGLELYADAEGHVAFQSKALADRIG
jgi:hypothetical protein